MVQVQFSVVVYTCNETYLAVGDCELALQIENQSRGEEGWSRPGIRKPGGTVWSRVK